MSEDDADRDVTWVRPVTNIKDAPAYRAVTFLTPRVGSSTAARLAVSQLVRGRNSALSKCQMLQRDCGLTAMEAAELMRSLGIEHAQAGATNDLTEECL